LLKQAVDDARVVDFCARLTSAGNDIPVGIVLRPTPCAGALRRRPRARACVLNGDCLQSSVACYYLYDGALSALPCSATIASRT
jgi:hypothetical protein